MKRAVFALLAMTAVASFSGCCCLDQLFCRPFWCRGGCGGCCDGGCDGGCDSCGVADHGGGCDSCGIASNSHGGGHQVARRPRYDDDGGQYAAGPPTGGVAYPYYTNRGPRDFLAKNPPSIGP